jgi:hypothetical protein
VETSHVASVKDVVIMTSQQARAQENDTRAPVPEMGIREAIDRLKVTAVRPTDQIDEIWRGSKYQAKVFCSFRGRIILGKASNNLEASAADTRMKKTTSLLIACAVVAVNAGILGPALSQVPEWGTDQHPSSCLCTEPG